MGSLEPSGVTLQTLETSSRIVSCLSKPLSVTPRNRNRNHRILEFMYSILVWVGGKRKMRCVKASCDLCRCVLATGGLRSEGTRREAGGK